MKKSLNIFIFCFFLSVIAFAQQNSIAIKSTLDTDKDELLIQQEIIFYNTFRFNFNNIYLHNWANSFKDRKTPLSKRFIKDYKKPGLESILESQRRGLH